MTFFFFYKWSSLLRLEGIPVSHTSYNTKTRLASRIPPAQLHATDIKQKITFSNMKNTAKVVSHL